MRRTGSLLGIMFIAAALFVGLWLLLGVAWRAYASHTDSSANPLPHATLRVWPTRGSAGLGFDPDESVADPTGLTMQVATTKDPLTIVTVWENTTCAGGACGISFWNPMTNVFKCIGVTFGFQAAVDINRAAPVKTAPSAVFGMVTFQPGDAWASGPTSIPIYVVFKGTARLRGYLGLSPWGIEVDQSTGDILFAGQEGTINKLDPATNRRTRWLVGGGPRFLTRDTLGRIYATVGCLNQIVRVDPATNTVLRWAVPGGGLTCGFVFATPDGITRDADGKIWFTESVSNQIGRLSGGPDGIIGTPDDVICQYGKPGLSNPQLIATTGSDAPPLFTSKNLQAYFTEGLGNATSILTQREASGGASRFETCVTVAPTSSTVTPTTSTVSVSDFTKPVTTKTITPVTFDIPGLNGGPDATGTTKTAGPDGIPGNADDERIAGILRFFLGATGNTFPSGMTDVAAPNTIYGSFLGSENVFEFKSRAIIAPPPPRDYLVGDAFPSIGGDSAGQFGDNTLTIVDLIYGLRAVNNVPGFRPLSCADRYDAVDSHPPDTATARGGDGALNNRDLIITLRRLNNVDSSRPRRLARGLPCPAGVGNSLLLARETDSAADPAAQDEAAAGSLEFGAAQAGEGGALLVPVYLSARTQLSLAGFSFSVGLKAEGEALRLQFVPGPGPAPTLLDQALPGVLALAWLDDLWVNAHDRILLGFVQITGLETTEQAATLLQVYGIVADSTEEGRNVPLASPARIRGPRAVLR